jgi:hypothetical protein
LPDHLLAQAVPRICRPRFTERNAGPLVIAAAVAQASIAISSQVGIDTVPTRPSFPDQIHNAPAAITPLDVLKGGRRYFGATESAAEQHREDGRFRTPLVVVASGAFRSACACLAVSQSQRIASLRPGCTVLVLATC